MESQGSAIGLAVCTSRSSEANDCPTAPTRAAMRKERENASRLHSISTSS